MLQSTTADDYDVLGFCSENANKSSWHKRDKLSSLVKSRGFAAVMLDDKTIEPSSFGKKSSCYGKISQFADNDFCAYSVSFNYIRLYRACVGKTNFVLPAHSSMLTLHRLPVNPGLHEQVKLLIPSWHVPVGAHVSFLQSLMLTSQSFPVKPSGQVH